jgi:hypothetical protein|tara:strand:- start:436 stop:654 length:219 start_codon:yes stop_codon:yes gene_type:complete
MNCKTCPVCKAGWIDDQLYWTTGKIGCPHDLAGLICNSINHDDCINPCKGSTSGMTWKHREAYMSDFEDRMG